MKRKVFPLIAGLTALLVIIAAISQGLFAMMSSAGFVCTATPSNHLRPSMLENGSFPSKDLCWASGVGVEEDKRYQITLTINYDEWRDLDIKAGINGFGVELMPWTMYSGLLFRRHIREPWFKPIARIGHQGSDEYPLTLVAVGGPDQTPKRFVAEITARRSGELFLFVNDAVLPLPNDWQFFYNNNTGTATVTVKAVTEPNG
jgi:hypothetical protein